MLGIKIPDPTKNLDYYDSEMNECTDDYVQYVAEILSMLNDPVVMVEQRLDFSKYVPDGFGTGDCVIVADNVLTIIDYKHGKGVAVSAEQNTQMMLYALGALDIFEPLYEVNSVVMVIFQPRLNNVSEYTVSVTELMDWAENTLRPIALLASKGEGDFCAGEHCRFCRVKATCRKRAEYNLSLARYDFAQPDMLTDDEISSILDKADILISWAGDVKEYALSEALKGRKWQGYKVVEGRSSRKYTDENAVAQAVKAYGENPYSEPELLGVTAMTKLLGKKTFNEVLGDLTYKPQGKPTLVPVTDKRQEWTPAQEDFKED